MNVTQQTQQTWSEARRLYDEKGCGVYRSVLDADLLQDASRHLEWLQKKNPGLRPEKLDTHLISDDPFWVRLIGDDRLLDVAQQFIGPDIALFASHYICKPPYDGQPVLWHQDGCYWPLEPMEVVTLWLAVDDSTPENGCLRVIPGTHALGLQELQPRTDMVNVLGSAIDQSLVDELNAVDLVLGAGDVSIHHPNLIHGSNANNSPKRRGGLTIRYIPTSTRIVSNKPWQSAFLLRGKPVSHVNQYLPWPKWVEGKHMPFNGVEQWNERCEEHNRSLRLD